MYAAIGNSGALTLGKRDSPLLYFTDLDLRGRWPDAYGGIINRPAGTMAADHLIAVAGLVAIQGGGVTIDDSVFYRGTFLAEGNSEPLLNRTNFVWYQPFVIGDSRPMFTAGVWSAPPWG
jgi:hypothetical protein